MGRIAPGLACERLRLLTAFSGERIRGLKEGKLDLVEGGLPVSAAAPQAVAERLRRAKIICTIGPACDSEELICDLMRMGLDVARLNFSHRTHSENARRIQLLPRAARNLTRPICMLHHLQSPKLRPARLQHAQPGPLRVLR